MRIPATSVLAYQISPAQRIAITAVFFFYTVKSLKDTANLFMTKYLVILSLTAFYLNCFGRTKGLVIPL